jgi:hypothetical protein
VREKRVEGSDDTAMGNGETISPIARTENPRDEISPLKVELRRNVEMNRKMEENPQNNRIYLTLDTKAQAHDGSVNPSKPVRDNIVLRINLFDCHDFMKSY